jgi:hypothetical protein
MVIWYPEMTGSLNPANKYRSKSPGFYNGKIRMSIKNWEGSNTTIFERAKEALINDVSQSKKGDFVTYFKKENDEFDLVYEIHEGNKADRIIYVKEPRDEKGGYFITCYVNRVSSACTVEITLDKAQNITVEYTYSEKLFHKWKEIDAKVRKLVSSFVVTSFAKY